MKTLHDILTDLADRYRWHRAELLLEVERVWPEAVGPQIARVTRPIGWLDGVLTIAVPSPVWTQELRYLEEELLSAVNQQITGGEVRRIRTVVRPGIPASAGGTRQEATARLGDLSKRLHEPPPDEPH
ncbi:MAG: DUF721 domain-containing protein [Thermaerobacter sp.]|nr:DUF721 domain-containing protein [Thermaerobacter sp.]